MMKLHNMEIMFFNVLPSLLSSLVCNQFQDEWKLLFELLRIEVKNKVSLPESIMYFILMDYSCLCSQWWRGGDGAILYSALRTSSWPLGRSKVTVGACGVSNRRWMRLGVDDQRKCVLNLTILRFYVFIKRKHKVVMGCCDVKFWKSSLLWRNAPWAARTPTSCWPWTSRCFVAMTTQLVAILLCHCGSIIFCSSTETFHAPPRLLSRLHVPACLQRRGPPSSDLWLQRLPVFPVSTPQLGRSSGLP